MTEIGLQRPRIPPRVRLVKSACVPQHMGVRLDFESGDLTSLRNQLLEVGHRHRRAALGHEQERRSAFGVAMQAAQYPQLPARQWVSLWRAVLGSGDRERRSGEINLGPLQVTDLGNPQPVPERQQDHGRVAVRPAIALTTLDEPLDLAFG